MNAMEPAKLCLVEVLIYYLRFFIVDAGGGNRRPIKTKVVVGNDM
jgi:hypothetical protein